MYFYSRVVLNQDPTVGGSPAAYCADHSHLRPLLEMQARNRSSPRNLARHMPDLLLHHLLCVWSIALHAFRADLWQVRRWHVHRTWALKRARCWTWESPSGLNTPCLPYMMGRVPIESTRFKGNSMHHRSFLRSALIEEHKVIPCYVGRPLAHHSRTSPPA